MSKVSLKAFRVSEMTLINKIEGGIRAELENKYSYNVRYNKENKVCTGEFSVEVRDKINSEKLSIKVVAQGVFVYDSSLSKEQIHALSYREIFPYVKSVVTTLTVNCGMTPIMIPGVDIESQNIYRFEKPQ